MQLLMLRNMMPRLTVQFVVPASMQMLPGLPLVQTALSGSTWMTGPLMLRSMMPRLIVRAASLVNLVWLDLLFAVYARLGNMLMLSGQLARTVRKGST